METIVSSVTSHEDADAKKKAADSIPDETEEESPSPAITQPPHTSPDISFASEVTPQHTDLQKQIQEAGHNKILFDKKPHGWKYPSL